MPMFQKRHYEAIAKMISNIEKHAIPYSGPFNNLDTFRWMITRDDLMLALAKLFKDDNPLFDRTRFINACGFRQLEPGRDYDDRNDMENPHC